MKKLFLTSGLVLCMVGSALATSDIDSSGNVSGSAATCVDDVLGTYSGSTSFNAKWQTNVSGAITLNSNRWTSNDAGSAASTASVDAAPTPLYSVYDVGIYQYSTDANARNGNTLSGITTAPQMTGYTFAGFYTTKASGGTLVINTDKTFTSEAKNVISSQGGTGIWYARWTPINYTITFDKNTKDINNRDLVNQSGTVVAPTGTSPTSQVYAYDSTANLTTNGYSVTGYTFDGWQSNHTLTTVAGTGTPIYDNNQSINYKYPGAATLTARWKPNISGAISLVSSVYPSNNRSQTALYTTDTVGADKVTAPTTATIYTKYNTGVYSDSTATTDVVAGNLKPSQGGYKFNGFYNSGGTSMYIDSDGTPTAAGKRAVTGNTTDTWYANWEPNEYKITYKPGVAGSRTVSGSNQEKAVYYDGTTYKDGSALNTMASNTFSITGYSFSNWKSNKVISTGAASSTQTYNAATGLTKYKVIGDTEMTAQWTPNCYGAVSLDNNKYNATTPANTDYEVNGSSIYVKYDNGWYTAAGCGTAATVSKPSLTGYTFGGYYTEKNGAGTQMATATPAITTDGKTITSAQTWYAKWTANVVGITYTCGTAPTVSGLTITTGGSVPSGANVTFDTPYTIASTQNGCALSNDRGGYHFGGWTCSVDPDDNNGTATYTATKTNNTWTVSHTVSAWKASTDVTCDAIWTGNTYHISYVHGTAGSRTEGFSGNMSAGEDVVFGQNHSVAANAFSIPGYHFDGWSGDYSNDTGNAATTLYAYNYSFSPYKIAHDLTLTAQWEPNVYEITLKNYDGTETESTIYEKYDNGWFISVDGKLGPISAASVPTRTGYLFRGYYTTKQPDLTANGGSGTRDIRSSGELPSNSKYTSQTTLFSAWAKECTQPAHGSCTTTINNDGTVSYTASCDTGYTVSGATTATPSCDANCNAITLNANGGTANSVTTLYKKTGTTGWFSDSSCATAWTSNANVVPSRTGFTFRGFYSADLDDVSSDNSAGTQYITTGGASSTAGTAWTVNAPNTVYAAWATVCTQPNNGTCSLNVSTAGAVDYTTSCVSAGYTLNGNNTATPTCTANKYTVTYVCGGKPGSELLTCSGTPGCTAAGPTSTEFTFASGYTLPNNAGTCQYKGWSFDGWKCNHDLGNGAAVANYSSTNTNGSSFASGATGTYNVIGNVECKATWKANNIGLSWNIGAGATPGETAGGISCDYDSGITVPDAPTRTGYTFIGWTVQPCLNDYACGLSSSLTSTNGSTVGYYNYNQSEYSNQNVGTYNLSSGEWATSFSHGTVKGIAACSNTGASVYDNSVYKGLPSEGTQENAVWASCSSDAIKPSNTFSTSNSSGSHCWCKVTNYTATGGSACSTGSKWVLAQTWEDGAAHCPSQCAKVCAEAVRDRSVLRTALFGTTGL